MKRKDFSIIVFVVFSLTYMNCKQENHHARISKLIGFDFPRGYNLTDYSENNALSYAYSGKLILPDSKVYIEKAELILKKYNEIVFDTLKLKLYSNSLERSKNKNHYIRNKYDIFKEKLVDTGLVLNQSLYIKETNYSTVMIYGNKVYFEQYNEIFD